MKNVIFVLIGGALMFIVLKYMSKGKPIPETESQQRFRKLMATPEAQALVQSDEFVAMAMTREFRDVLKSVADEFIHEMAKQVSLI